MLSTNFSLDEDDKNTDSGATHKEKITTNTLEEVDGWPIRKSCYCILV